MRAARSRISGTTFPSPDRLLRASYRPPARQTAPPDANRPATSPLPQANRVCGATDLASRHSPRQNGCNSILMLVLAYVTSVLHRSRAGRATPGHPPPYFGIVKIYLPAGPSVKSRAAFFTPPTIRHWKAVEPDVAFRFHSLTLLFLRLNDVTVRIDRLQVGLILRPSLAPT
jgi:hypothetical protein